MESVQRNALRVTIRSKAIKIQAVQVELHGSSRKVVLVPQELVVLDDASDQVEKRLVLLQSRGD